MQNLKKLREEEKGNRATCGLSDGGHVYIPCSKCGAILLDVWRTLPNEPEIWKLKGNCPFCSNGCSFITEVKGGFHIGGYGVVKEDSPDDDVASTVVDVSEAVGDVIVFKIRKASENAKPVYHAT